MTIWRHPSRLTGNRDATNLRNEVSPSAAIITSGSHAMQDSNMHPGTETESEKRGALMGERVLGVFRRAP